MNEQTCHENLTTSQWKSDISMTGRRNLHMISFIYSLTEAAKPGKIWKVIQDYQQIKAGTVCSFSVGVFIFMLSFSNVYKWLGVKLASSFGNLHACPTNHA